MAKRYELEIKIDYLSMVFESICAEELILRVMNMPLDLFLVQDKRVKYKEYTKIYQLGSVKVFGGVPESEGNPGGLGCYLVLRGKGCDEFINCFTHHEGYFGDFFSTCNIYRFRSQQALRFHLTRLDIAIDDRNPVPYFTIDQIQKKCLKEEFISQSRSFRFAESSFGEGETAKTVYIGDGKSDISYRFYEKDKEMSSKYNLSYEEMGSWKRTEIQLRDEVAHNFAMLMAEEPDRLGMLTFNFLGTSLRFVTREASQSNKSRWKTSRFWARFLGAIEPLKIRKDTSPNSLYETQDWLRDGGAMSAVKAFQFLEANHALGDLMDMNALMYNIRYSPTLSCKVVSHLCQIGRDDLIPLIYQDTKNT